MAVEWDEITYLAAYEVGCRDNTHPHYTYPPGSYKFGYGRVFSDHTGMYAGRFGVLTANFAIQPTDRILIVGCGFGYLIEQFHDNGYPNVWGIDGSPYIADNRGTEARGSVLWVEENLTGAPRIKSRLRQLTGGSTFDWIISEEVVDGHDDIEVPSLLDAAESVLTGANTKNIIHFVTPNNDFVVSRTWEQLVALRPSHSWVWGNRVA